IVEFLLLFWILPLVFTVAPLPRWPLAVLWLVTLYCYLVLRRQPQFDSDKLWSIGVIRAHSRSILAVFIPVACPLSVAVYGLIPQAFLSLPKRTPFIWGVVMVLYPLLSVIPQTIIYRAFIFSRYDWLFPSARILILASAASFSWLHIVMRNPV